MRNLKYNTNELIYETETDSQKQRTDLWLPRVRGQGRDGVGVWGQQMQIVIYRMDEQQGAPVEHRDLYSIFCDKPSWKRT